MKKLLVGAALTLGLSMSAQASMINVGGVQWDPDQTLAFPALSDFVANGTIFETGAVQEGDVVTGRGQVTNFNSSLPNNAAFCPGCELTFTFSMVLDEDFDVSNTFKFRDLFIDFYVDHTPDFDGTAPTAGDGNLWLSLGLPPGEFLTGTGTNLGTGSDSGTGTALIDVLGGMAAGNFDTNTQVNGADMVLSSSFQPTQGQPGLLNGTFDLTGNSIPEPSSIALLGLGLLGFAGAARRKKA
ncbi:PEP-CTERM sorting domain-containing protein [Flocculibacter collagenilyticus]|uniref:PEP-CTERM sorting domain-containing protein n=1 Tax=Flocculibacter collagenilyticus TaxID=2744479 RepID=UPI0018F7A71B|nr:PEP-CTERM sorting domain-containing protein [Flocculibacter collagenilyticus]